jgi:hypothetical protein
VKTFLLRSALLGPLVVLSVSRACGPDFPNSYLAQSLDEITALPSLGFARELERLLPPEARPAAARGEAHDPGADEIGEVREALTTAGLSRIQVERRIRTYDRHHPCADLPAEFHLYAQGANAWIARDPAGAVKAWRQLLALPEQDRYYRTVWAAYMLGRVLYISEPETARESFQLARDAAARGFPDSQDLAAASLGWEARGFLAQRDYKQALRLYLRQFSLGDPSAVRSLQRTMQYAFFGRGGSDGESGPSPDQAAFDAATGCTFVPAPCSSLWDIAADRDLRAVVLAWFVSRGGPYGSWGKMEVDQIGRWVDLLQAVKDLGPDEAERWAFATYQCGLWNAAGRFVSRAEAGGPLGEWVRAMLLLRGGFVDDAAAHLANAARGFPRNYYRTTGDTDYARWIESPWQRLAGVQGALALRRDQYSDALRIFLEAGHWQDAAFVAERILTTDELLAYVTSEVPAPTGSEQFTPYWSALGLRDTALAGDLRYLLGRRLARANRFAEARAFYPDSVRQFYDSYVADTRAGFDLSRPPDERAARLWSAARTIRAHGMELLGTEMEPDFEIWAGDFQVPALWGSRYAGVRYDPYDDAHFMRLSPDHNAGVLAPTDGELQRAFAHPPPPRRFHYRARAIELAWLAAGLLPNDDDRTALILDTAGRWFAGANPEEADLFYKSLVVRCPETTLGRKAREAHWFPKKPKPDDN